MIGRIAGGLPHAHHATSFVSVRFPAAHVTRPATCRPPRSRSLARRCRVTCTANAGADGYNSDMRWSSYVSRRINLDLAVEEAVAEALKTLGGEAKPEVAVVFVSSAFVEEYGQLVPELRKWLPSLKLIFGSTGYGVIGTTAEGPEEIEHAPALSISLGFLPGVVMQVTRVTASNIPDGDAPPDAWADLLGVPQSAAASSSFLVLADPSFQPVEELLVGLDYAFPEANKIGGLTSAGKMSPVRAMFAWSKGQREADSMFRTGAVVLSLSGGVSLELMVAQGCRPLTPYSYTITRVEQGAKGGVMVLGLSRKGLEGGEEISPVEALGRDLKGQFTSKAQLTSLLSNLALGVAPGGLRAADTLEPQDFLIRGVLLERSGHMLVMDSVRVGERIRFMVRGREGAKEDLKAHGLAYKRKQLAAVMEGRQPARALGMLMFSCNGRGTNLYDEPGYDARTMGSFVRVPTSGFLCNGEIATVGGSTKLHGFTCAAAVLHERLPVATSQQQDAAAVAAPGEASRSGVDSSSDSSSSSSGSRSKLESRSQDHGSEQLQQRQRQQQQQQQQQPQQQEQQQEQLRGESCPSPGRSPEAAAEGQGPGGGASAAQQQ